MLSLLEKDENMLLRAFAQYQINDEETDVKHRSKQELMQMLKHQVIDDSYK